MLTLKNSILGDVIDILHSPKSNRFYLVLDPDLLAGQHYLVPLLCPVCGEPWHFIRHDTQEQLTAALTTAFEGFELADVKFFSHTTADNISATMKALSIGSEPFELFIANAADHIGVDTIFPAMMLAFEQRLPTTLPSPEELRTMHPEEVRELLDLEPSEDLEAAILEFEGWRTSDDFEDFDVEDDIYLVVHPNAILDAIIVEPEFDAEDFHSYPYQEMIELFEDSTSEDENADLGQLKLGNAHDGPADQR